MWRMGAFAIIPSAWKKPVVKVDGDKATVTYTSVLNANAYGARGTFRMKGTHHYEKRDDAWIAVNP